MAKFTWKTKYKLQEEEKESSGRRSDDSCDDVSEEDSELFDDSEEDTQCHLDKDWEPDTSSPGKKRSRGVAQLESTSSEEESSPPTPQRGSSRRKRPRERRSSSQAELSSSASEEKWNDMDIPDTTPPQPTFTPKNSPGPQLVRTETYTALQLFQLFFTNSILLTVIQNTNKYGSIHYSPPSNPWIDLTLEDMFSFLSLIIYLGLVKCPSLSDYWKRSKLYSFPFPAQVMSGKKFFRMCRALHLSSMEADAANEEKRGTTDFDRLCKIKPIYDEIRDACKRNFHPGQEISIDERMVASKARIGLKQYMKEKPTRWGYKVFVLADSRNGYTWDFFVYEGKYRGKNGKGVCYETVMELLDTRLLGTGYKLFVDNFYTSPTLFRDLLQKKIWACGTIRPNLVGFPKTKENILKPKAPRGSLRWIRKDSLLFVLWRDTKDVFLCSTLHTAHGEDTVQRRTKEAHGQWVKKDVPVPLVVKDYNRFMGGVDLSDALIKYYRVNRKTQKWYKTFFYHFIDIAVVNAFLLHKDLANAKGEVPMKQRSFRQALITELAEMQSPSKLVESPIKQIQHHRPVYICQNSTYGRQRCRHCQAKTPVKCSSCDVPLCFVASRDCYNAWHVDKNL